jgi:DnaK suppressor protein
MLNQEFIQKMKTRLEEEKAQVKKKMADLTKPEEPMDNPDNEEIAQDAEEDILEQSLLNVHKNILEKINDALYRIQDNTYGRCILCGAEISTEDLEKEPWAEHCRACRK